MTSLQVNYFKYMEEKRHNWATEQESQRHNVQSENVGFMQAQAAQSSAYAANRQAAVQEAMLPYNQAYTAANTARVQAETFLTRAKAVTEGWNTALVRQKVRTEEQQTKLTQANTGLTNTKAIIERANALYAFRNAKTNWLTNLAKLDTERAKGRLTEAQYQTALRQAAQVVANTYATYAKGTGDWYSLFKSVFQGVKGIASLVSAIRK